MSTIQRTRWRALLLLAASCVLPTTGCQSMLSSCGTCGVAGALGHGGGNHDRLLFKSCGVPGLCEAKPACPEFLDPHVPRELTKVSHPPYVVEPPDVLLVQVVKSVRLPNDPLGALDALLIQVNRGLPIDAQDDEVTRQFKRINGVYRVQAEGTINLGPEYGSVMVKGFTLSQARDALVKQLQTKLKGEVTVTVTRDALTEQPVAGAFAVRQDGTLPLGIYGSVYVSGLTLSETQQHIADHLAQYMLDPEVTVDILLPNSKVYYVIADGGGFGQ
ncbi:MAG: polysaccharide biosynthesis/export family protein, partial [Planctomycetia bacterium]